VETESAFSGSDANGHFVRVMTLVGTCTVGLDVGCASPGTAGAPNGAVTTSPAPKPPGSQLSDQELLRLFLDNQ
jgi:hypothetical protein